MNTIPQLTCEALHQLYEEVDNLKCDEIHAAQGKQVAVTRVRVKLARIIRLAKRARKEIPANRKRRIPMEKYGVDQDKDPGKTAEDDSNCSSCDSELEKHGDIKLCPKCGSEPLEEDETESESPNEK